MRKDLLGIVVGPKAVLLVFRQKFEHQVDELVRIVNFVFPFLWENQFRCFDFGQQDLPLAIEERCYSDRHLINENAEGPPVNAEVVSGVSHHFWCQVLGRSTESLRQLSRLKRFGQSIVDYLKVAPLVHKDILELQVSMHDSFLVQVSDSHANLRSVKPDNFLWKAFVLFEHLVQFTTLDERHHKVQPLCRLKQILHSHEEGVLATEQNVLLKLSVLDLIVVNQHVFTDYLYCVLLRGTLELGQENFPERAFPYQELQLEVLVLEGSIVFGPNQHRVFEVAKLLLCLQKVAFFVSIDIHLSLYLHFENVDFIVSLLLPPQFLQVLLFAFDLLIGEALVVVG